MPKLFTHCANNLDGFSFLVEDYANCSTLGVPFHKTLHRRHLTATHVLAWTLYELCIPPSNVHVPPLWRRMQ